jgi:hypothetical protein
MGLAFNIDIFLIGCLNRVKPLFSDCLLPDGFF